jgi:hypothetical protein
MRTKKLLATAATLAFILILQISCAKEDPAKKEPEKPECETKKTGTITVSNSSSNPYDIYIDNVHQVKLAGNSISAKLTISEGNNRTLFAKQASGYLLTPTEKTAKFNVVACSDYSWQIP